MRRISRLHNVCGAGKGSNGRVDGFGSVTGKKDHIYVIFSTDTVDNLIKISSSSKKCIDGSKPKQLYINILLLKRWNEDPIQKFKLSDFSSIWYSLLWAQNTVSPLSNAMIWFTGTAHGEAVQAECVGRRGGRRQSTAEASVCDTRDCKDWARLCAGLKPDGQWLHRSYARPQMWDQNAWRLESWQGQIGLRQRRTNLRVA